MILWAFFLPAVLYPQSKTEKTRFAPFFI
jgi:hypothetical protein